MSFISLFINKQFKKLREAISDLYFIKSEVANFAFYKKSKPFLEISFSSLPHNVQKSFEIYNNTEQFEYFLEMTGSHYIEPNCGWIFDKNLKKYYTYSFPHSELEKKPDYFKIKLKSYKIIQFDTAISIRYHFHNYWHFFNDVLGQIAYIFNLGIDINTPIIVPSGVLEIGYIKQIIASSPVLKNLNWVVQNPGTLISANRIILAKNLPNTKQNFLNILGLLDPDFPSHATSGANRKIFIVRRSGRGRTISNFGQIEPILQKYGFEIVDNDCLSFEEQKAIFKDASFIAGIHGAGLTNMIFRYPPHARILEIFPSNLIPPHYYWLSSQLGFTYECLVGEKEENGRFYLNPDTLMHYFNPD